ncbi:glycine betaine ABC transporter substrate-binding protein [Martelella endophytica]|uniref:ABC transporter substrate-binding protein n=1 Tax=Martelella endophytica TaxID=1486262 RepID=A0A0D5LS98_MAREN|nr:glycine betaine ABC transporter substrate-binding protein [Martelella endophytica]AJY47074.1 ABC transporter substrate-binding protein [Martelella endophytica]
MRALLAAAACVEVLLASAALADETEPQCGTVTEAELNWASAGIAAWVDKLIMENGYGCTVDLVEGNTDSTLSSITSEATPDIIPEFWYEGASPELDEAVADQRVAFAAALLSEGGVQGWWMPKFLADANPEITTVQRALDHPELFPGPDGSSDATVYNCPPGWTCHISTENLFRALGGKDKGFTLLDAENGLGLEQSIAHAFEEKVGWLGYYWAPTAILGKYEMVKLSFGIEFDKGEWDRCTIVPDCPDPNLNAYPVSAVYTLVTGEFVSAHPALMDYLNARSWDNRTISSVLAWMEDNDANNEAAARYFLENHPELWKSWLPEDVAAKVDAAL